MRKKSNIIVGLDIGTASVTMLLAEMFSDGRLDIIGVGTVPSRGLRKGVVINIEATVASIHNAMQQAETMAGCEAPAVIAALSGSHISGMNSHGIVGIRNREVTAYDIGKVIDAAKAVAIPLDRELIHVIPKEFIIDDQDGIQEPLGISGVRLEARVHMITGSTATARNVVKCANRCGLTVKDLVVSSLASVESVVSPEEQELGALLLDIGAGTTDLAIVHRGSVRHTAVVPIGGNHITSDIAAGLRTPVAEAEKIKCDHGVAISKLITNQESVRVPSTGGREHRIVSKGLVADIIEPRVKELFQLVQEEVDRSQTAELMNSGVVLTGGGAKLKNIVELATNHFSLPVRIGLPSGPGGLMDLVGDPAFSTVVGLVQHTARGQLKSYSEGTSQARKALRKVGNWLGDHF